MSWEEHHPTFGIAQTDGFPFDQQPVGLGFGVSWKSIIGCVGLDGFQHGNICGVNGERKVVPAFDMIIAQHVVDVPMGVDQQHRLQLFIRDVFVQRLPFGTLKKSVFVPLLG